MGETLEGKRLNNVGIQVLLLQAREQQVVSAVPLRDGVAGVQVLARPQECDLEPRALQQRGCK